MSDPLAARVSGKLDGPAAGSPASGGASERFLFLTALAAAVAVLAVLAWPLFAGQVYTLDDLGNYHLAARYFYSKSLAAGDAFTWFPNVFCGFYLHGEGQAGMLHPLHLALYRLLPFVAAFNIDLLLPYPLMLVGMFFFLRRWRLGAAASMFGALTFAFSGFNLLHFVHPNAIAIVAHIPFLLLAIDVMLRPSSPRSRPAAFAAVALLTASEVLFGYPQYVWISCLAEGLYALLLIPVGRSWRALPLFAASKALGFLIGAVQLLPTAVALLESRRAAPGSSFAYEFSLDPSNLIQLVGPYLLRNRVGANVAHEYVLYDGAVTAVLILWLVASARRLGSKRWLALGAMVAAAVFLDFAFGAFGHFYPLIAKLPLVGYFRAPARFVVLVHLSAAVGAAVAFANICDTARRGQKATRLQLGALAGLVLLSVVLALLAGWPGVDPTDFFSTLSAFASSNRLLIIAGPVIVACAAALVFAAARGVRFALPLVILFAAADQGVYGLSYIWTVPPRTLASFVDSLPSPPAEAGARIVAAREADDSPALKGMKLLGGYAGIAPARLLDYASLPAWRVAGVEWVPLGSGLAPDLAAGRSDDGLWLKVPEPLPRARLVARTALSENPGADLKTVDVDAVALVAESIDLPEGALAAAEVLVDRPGYISLRVDAPSRRLLVLSESYHSGWRATVDGRPAKVLRVNGDFLGCVVEAGSREVSFDFRPGDLRIAVLVTCAGILATAVVTLLLFLRRRRTAP